MIRLVQHAWLLLFAWLASPSPFRVLADTSDSQLLLQASWAAQVGWNSATDMCNWTGITCTAEQATNM